MNRFIKILAFVALIMMLFSCTGKQSVFVGDVSDINGFKRPANITHYQWSFDTKPPASRLDPRDFIPSNYHPNVSFIPDAAGRYIVRLAMRDAEGKILHKNFIFEAEIQPDYLNNINRDVPKASASSAKNTEDGSKSSSDKTAAKKPARIIKTDPIIKKKTITRKPNEWQKAPNPNENPNYVVKEPDYLDAGTTVATLRSDKTGSRTKSAGSQKIAIKTPSKSTTEEFQLDPAPIPAPDVNVEAYQAYLERMKNQPALQDIPRKKEESLPSAAVQNTAAQNVSGKYTLQLASSSVEAYAYEELEKLQKQGMDTYMQQTFINGKLYYRIRMGYYATYADAKAARAYVINTTDMEPWIDKIK